MPRIAYVNGRYCRYAQACVHVEDRGLQFADAVYEAFEVLDGHIIDETRHLTRLARSLSELRMRAPMATAALKIVLRETLRRNHVRDGVLYMQVSRGVAPRDHVFPPADIAPGLIVLARARDAARAEAAALGGIAVITRPDERWARVDIKTTGLLPNVLAKQAAREAGAREAWLVDGEGFVTEGGSTNAWIVSEAGVLVTRPADRGILRGVTRTTVIDVAREEGLPVEERAFSVAEAKAAREAFLTSATNLVTPVIRIDGEPVGGGRPGPLSLRLRARFHAVAEAAPL